jgi:antitoxin component of MazEF toxin-antitoxin module
VLILGRTVAIGSWGNSKGIRIPSDILKSLGLDIGDSVYLNAEDGKITISKTHAPKKGTLEYLFKDYKGDSFKTNLNDLGAPIGDEKW